MKKHLLRTLSITVSLALLFVLSAEFSACGKEKTAESVLRSVCDALEDAGQILPPARYTYVRGALEGTKGCLTAALAGLLYYGSSEANVRELDLLSDYAIRLPDDQSVYEIHVMRCKNPSDRDKIAELLGNRLKMLQNTDIYLYVPDAYEGVVASGKVTIKGNFVILLITPDNRAAQKGL